GKPGPEDDRIIRIVADPQGTLETLDASRPAEPVLEAPGPDMKDPAKLINIYCAACHGPGLAGGLQRNLLLGEWKQVKSDDDIERIITDGVPQVGMPPTKGL